MVQNKKCVYLYILKDKGFMEKKFEKIDENIINEIKEHQEKLGNIVLEVGQLHFRKKELEKEVEKLKIIISSKENEFEVSNSKISKILDELNTKYGDGELDLNQGGIYY